jgi:hypothetical protein
VGYATVDKCRCNYNSGQVVRLKITLDDGCWMVGKCGLFDGFGIFGVVRGGKSELDWLERVYPLFGLWGYAFKQRL